MAERASFVVVPGPKLHPFQPFHMVRHGDETGVSGTGVVLDGAVFPTGVCIVVWRGATPCTQIWDSFAAFKRVHIDPHPDNKTEIQWLRTEKDDGATAES